LTAQTFIPHSNGHNKDCKQALSKISRYSKGLNSHESAKSCPRGRTYH